MHTTTHLSMLRIAITASILTFTATTAGLADPLPRADVSKTPDTTKPVKVFVLSGQSNMLEMGTIGGRTSGVHEDFYPNAAPAEGERKKFVNIAVYKGAWSPDVDYDKAEPVYSGLIEMGDPRMQRIKRRRKAIPMEPFPDISRQDGHTTVLRGLVSVTRNGNYEVVTGVGEGTIQTEGPEASFNVTTVDGREVYRRNPGDSAPKTTAIDLEAGKRYPLKIVYFKKPNHDIRLPITNLPGTLDTMAASNPRYAWLKDEKGGWITRNDVFFLDVHPLVNKDKGKGNFLQIPTKPGGNGIGLELAFGSVMGTRFDEPVLLIRCACGNRGMAHDFRPPSRGGWEKDADGKYTWTGTEYRYLTEGVKWTLDHLAEVLPGYKGQGYDLAGLVWFQGHKDTLDANAAAEYEENLAAMIKDLRKDLGKPALPVAIATVAFDGGGMNATTQTVHAAQMSLGDAAKHPEFAGNVGVIDARPFWRDVGQSPADQGYHYNRNAETYTLVGEALGREMLRLSDRGGK